MSQKPQLNIRMALPQIESLRQRASNLGITLTELLSRLADQPLEGLESEANIAPFWQGTTSSQRPNRQQGFENHLDNNRLDTLERLVASALDGIALLNRQLFNKSMMAAEVQSFSDAVKPDYPAYKESAMTSSEALAKRIATLETALADEILPRIGSLEQRLDNQRLDDETSTLAKLESCITTPIAELQQRIEELSKAMYTSCAAISTANISTESADSLAQLEDSPVQQQSPKGQKLESVTECGQDSTTQSQSAAISIEADDNQLQKLTKHLTAEEKPEPLGNDTPYLTAASGTPTTQAPDLSRAHQGQSDSSMRSPSLPFENASNEQHTVPTAPPLEPSLVTTISDLDESPTPHTPSLRRETTAVADNDEGWVTTGAAFEIAKRNGYRRSKNTFAKLGESKNPQAAYARWGLTIDLERRGPRGRQTKWLRPK